LPLSVLAFVVMRECLAFDIGCELPRTDARRSYGRISVLNDTKVGVQVTAAGACFLDQARDELLQRLIFTTATLSSAIRSGLAIHDHVIKRLSDLSSAECAAPSLSRKTLVRLAALRLGAGFMPKLRSDLVSET
jgi:hypothetical protein